MEKTIFRKQKTVRVSIAGIVSLFVVLHGRWDQILKVVVTPSSYLIFAASFSVTILLLWYIHYNVQFLDQHYPWKRNMIYRGILQIIIGVFIPAVVDLALVDAYFHAVGQDMLDTGFLRFDFPLIILLLLILNVHQMIYNFLKNIHQLPDVEKDEKVEPRNDVLTVSHAGTCVRLNIKTDVLYCCRMGKRISIFTTDGKEYYICESLSNLCTDYHGAGLVQINRSTLLNKVIAQGYERGQRRDTLQVIIKQEYALIPSMKNSSFFVVTKEHIGAFKALFELQVETPRAFMQ